MKDRYIKLRDSGKMSYDFLYDYYTSLGGKIGKERFNNLYQQVCSLPETLEHLDKKFNLTLVVDSDFNFIKVVTEK